ncbi:MAG: HypC/HybG/HupF family hydrogenase formation chaperone [Chloroflexi bacterium]|nr:HypC/HybG/HupF family hydrogenase formation chaperone [Chloroflexota bacterium]
MCLAIPGRISQISQGVVGFPVGTVDFDGVAREVGLAFVPEATVGDYVIVHAGFAISKIDEGEAMQTLALLRQLRDQTWPAGQAPALPDSEPPITSP